MDIKCLLDGSSVNGLILKYKEQEEMLEVKLTVMPSPDAERKQALTWLAAMQKVATLIFSLNLHVCKPEGLSADTEIKEFVHGHRCA